MNPVKWMVALATGMVLLSLTVLLWPKSLNRPDLAELVDMSARGSTSQVILTAVVNQVPWDMVSVYVPYDDVPDGFEEQGVSPAVEKSDQFSLWVFTDQGKVTTWFELPRSSEVTRSFTTTREKSNLQFDIQHGGTARYNPR